MMIKIYSIITLFLCMALPAQDPPNILFLFSDDHAYQAISAYDYPLLAGIAQTPNIDRIADEGMIFNKSYVTNSICGPSRAVIQTGKYSHLNGFNENGDTFDGSQQTFPKLLQASGYQTALIGKWHLGSVPQGFDYFEYMNAQGQQGTYYNPRFSKNGENVTYTGYNSDIVTDLGLEWLENGRDDIKPFMLMLQYKATHGHWEPPLENLYMFDEITVPEPENLFDDYAYRGSAAALATNKVSSNMGNGRLKLNTPGDLNDSQRVIWEAAYEPKNQAMQDANLSGDERTSWNYQRYIKDYLRTAASMDSNIGRVLDYLETSGLARNTVVIYSSDQGFYLGEHGWFDKRFMYEESFRTPLVVRWPGTIIPGSVNNDLVSNLDFAGTFLEIAGAAVPVDMQGASLVPLFEGNTPTDWRASLYYQYYGYPDWHDVYRHYGVTTGRFKLIYYHDIDEWEFYDLKKDPREMINQYYIPENNSIINELKAELASLRQELEVPEVTPLTGLETVAVQQWTEVLPLTGCGDITHPDYDPFVTEHAADSCKVTLIDENNLSVKNKIKVFYNRGNKTIRLYVPGRNSRVSAMSVHRLDGSGAAALRVKKGGGMIWDAGDLQEGMYILRISTGQGNIWRKVAMY